MNNNVPGPFVAIDPNKVEKSFILNSDLVLCNFWSNL